MKTVSIRMARKADLADILHLYSQPEMDGGHSIRLEEAEILFDKFRQYPNYRIYVACNGDEVVGSYALLIMENLAHQGTPSGVVEDVVVAVEHQNKGIGRQMMQFAIEQCRNAGCYKMVLSSNLRRLDAHRFYESLGFEKHGYSFAITTKKDNSCF